MTNSGPPRVLMLGPDLRVRGGISSVEKLLIAYLPPRVSVTHIATMVEGSRARKLWVFLQSLATTRSTLRRGVEIVHIHFSSRGSSVRKEALARRAVRARIPVIMHAHGSEYRQYWQSMSDWQRRRTLWVLSHSAAVIVLGRQWRDFFAGIGVPEHLLYTLPNPVALPQLVPERHGRGTTTFLYLGIINDRKGAFDLLEAVRRLPPEVSAQSRFAIAGNGDGERLRQLVAQCGLVGKFEVLDWIDEQKRDALLAESDVFILPSKNEGLPMAMLEAMAWGLPVISTPVGSIPEVLRHGENGLLVEAGNSESIAAAIERMVCDEAGRREMGRLARLSVEPLSIGNYVRSLCAVYDSILLRAASEARG